MSATLLEIAKAGLAAAKKAGANDASATASRARDVTTKWRDGRLESVADAVSRTLSVGLYVDGRYGSISTSDLRPEAVERFLADGVALVRALAKDPHRKLPDPALYAGRSTADLGVFDPKLLELGADARLARAKAVEAGARAVSGAARILSVTATVSDSSNELARVSSNGFEGTFRHGWVSEEAEVAVKDDDGRRPSDWADATVRKLADLPEPGSIGRQAAERALARLGAKKLASGTKTVLVEARAARSLLRHLTGSPLGGYALQQRESFLEGKVGQKIASDVLTISDEPLLAGGLGSRPFDGEGMATKARVVVEKGTLRTFFLDTYYASKLGLAPTTGGPMNLVVTPGAKGLEALVKEVQDGLLVTSFLGGNSNSTTGAFSLGVSGFRLVKGKREEAVAEINVAGKHLELWKRLTAVGSDPYPYSSTRCPSLLFDAVSVAGT